MSTRVAAPRSRTTRTRVRVLICCLATLFVACAVGTPAWAASPAPRVTGPLTGGVHDRPWGATAFNPEDFGYTEQEYLVSGTAHAYGTARPDVPYVTRMVVYRPADPERFSGNVTVEWTNVTAQVDHAFEFLWLNRQTFANGDAYVVVSAQQAGACGILLNGQPMIDVGGISVPPCTPVSLKAWDPIRYGALWVPDDAYAFDVFSQVGSTLRNTTGVAPLGGLVPRTLIAIGLSQSAIALDNYIRTGADDAARVYDGIIIDGDGQMTLPSRYRVPTMHIWSEESGQMGVPTAAPNHRIWSVAGAAHVDWYGVRQSAELLLHNIAALPPMTAANYRESIAASSVYGQQGPNLSVPCLGSSQFQRRYAVNAAVAAMQRWVRTGEPAPVAPPFVYNGIKRAVDALPVELSLPLLAGGGLDLVKLGGLPWGLQRDAVGNALGWIRLPQMAVPVARYDGAICGLFGVTIPFAPEDLAQRYPTHRVYVDAMLAATRESVRERFMTRADGIEQMQMACSSAIPDWGVTPPAAQPAVCRNLDSAV